MYNENSNFQTKNIIVQFLFVALMIFVLIWLFPLKSDLKNLKTTSNGDNSDLTVLVDRIFNENIIAMKDAAKSYYTIERLPKNVGDKVKMTLGEMLEKKIILPFTDKHGKTCDATASYVEVTKYDTEYLMKVNLKCGDEENYLLVYMGCYDYCSTTVCEKNKTDVKAPVIYSSKTNQPVNSTPSKTTPSNPDPQPTPSNPTCAYKDGKYYDKNGNVTSKATYESQCVTKPANPTCAYKDGKYYDKNGNVTSKATYESQCVTKPANPTCAYKDGKYYDKNGNVTSKATYESQCVTKPANPTCAYKDGKYYDKNGNVTSKATYESQCVTKPVTKEYLYEYSKTTQGYYTETNWSDWSVNKVTANSNTAVQTKTVTTKKLVGYNVTRDYDYSKPIYGTKTVETGMYENKNVCVAYDYVKTGEYSYGDWQYVETVYLSYTPNNTDTVQYINVGENSTVCGSNCSATTTKAYKKYTRSTTAVTKYQCTKYEMKSTPITKTTKVITGYETKIVSKTPVYKEVKTTYYRFKTRTYHPGTTDKKWSVYNDTTLLSSGYSYTGNKKVK